jgi:hypothetical protein
VTSVGEFEKTRLPEPVSSVHIAARFALLGVASAVATPAPSPVTPVEIGSPVQLVRVPLAGVPKIGMVRVGLLAKTRAPDPVSFRTAAARLAEFGVVRNAATPVPSPVTPVEIGSPVAFVRTAAVGVPRFGAMFDWIALPEVPLNVATRFAVALAGPETSPVPDTDCQVAAVPEVAVKTCPTVGAAAAETETVVVADLSATTSGFGYVPPSIPPAAPVGAPPLPPVGVCQVAAVADVAVNT